MRFVYGTPTRFATIVNGISAVIGFGVSAYIARILGPEQFGIVAVIAGINASILSFFDVRLNDVSAKVFYQPVADAARGRSYQVGVLWLGLLGTATIALLTALLTTALGPLLVPFFTKRSIPSSWIAAGAFAAAIEVIANGALFLTRLSKDFYALYAWRLCGIVIAAVTTVCIMSGQGNLQNYYVAALAAALAQLVCCAFAWAHIWRWRGRVFLVAPDWRSAWVAFHGHLNFLWYGNLLGYVKLLQKSADVLVVAFFATERVTGIYKLSRQMIDQGLAIFQLSLYDIYYPQLVQAFAQKAIHPFREMARRLLKIAGSLTLMLLLGEAILLPHVIEPLFGAGYTGVQWPMMLLTSTFFFLVGLYPWLWSLFVGSGEVKAFTLFSLLAVAVQYITILILFTFWGPTAAAAMAGMVAYYLFLGPALWMLARRRHADFLPWGAPA